MKRKQSHFSTEEQIIKKIDDVVARKAELIQANLTEHSEEIRIKNDKAVRRIEDATLPRLKRTLAAFRTQPMPFAEKEVVLQK